MTGRWRDRLARAWAQERDHLLALGALCVLAVAIRAAFASVSMRYDEAFTYTEYASRSFVTVVTNLELPNNHVLHTVLVWLSTNLFGDTEAAIRLPALAAGAALVPATYLAGRAHYGRATGLLAAGLVAASSWLITYSTNARGYSLVALFFLVMVAAAPSLSRPGAWAGLVAFVLGGTLALYTNTSAVYALAVVFAWVALEALRPAGGGVDRAALLRLGGAAAAIAAAAVVLYSPAGSVPAWLTQPEPADVTTLARTTWEEWNRDLPVIVSILLVAGFAASAVLHRRIGATRVPLHLPAALVVGAAVVTGSAVEYTRVWLFLLPLYLILASAGLVAVAGALSRRVTRRTDATARRSRVGRARSLGAAASVALAVGLTALVADSRSPELAQSQDPVRIVDARAVMNLLEGTARPGDTVVYGPFANPTMAYYLDRYGVRASRRNRHYIVCPANVRCPPAQSSPRALVVVASKPIRETSEGNLIAAGLRQTFVGRPVLIRSFRWTRVYVVD